MKRFNLFRFVFALVLGCYINGVESQTCNVGYYLNDKGICTVLPYDDQSLPDIPLNGPGRCGAFDTTLKVKKYEYTKKLPGWIKKFDELIKHCKGLCLSDRNCTHFEYDDNNKKCSFIGKESFGTKDKNIVSGYGECPTTDKCLNFGSDFNPTALLSFYLNIKGSPRDCQKLCRRKDSPTVFGYRWSDQLRDVVNRDCYCAAARSFEFVANIDWISGDSRCPPCFFYNIKLRNLRNVENESPNPYLIKPTVSACQRSCKDNKGCTWFEFDRSNNECRYKNFITGEMKKKNVVYGSRDCNCDCNKNGAYDACSNDDVCQCKPGYQGPKCDQCLDEYYMPDRKAKICYPCNCPSNRTINRNCDHTGQCSCKQDTYTGKKCDRCVNGHNMTNNFCCPGGSYLDASTNNCIHCNCDLLGSKSPHCAIGGQCPCRSKGQHSGKQCTRCKNGLHWSNGYCCPNSEYYGNPKKPDSCTPCDCHPEGSIGKVCGPTKGQCTCKGRYNGRRCYDIPAYSVKMTYVHKHYTIKYRIMTFYCDGNCEIRELKTRTANSRINIDMYGSRAAWVPQGFSISSKEYPFCMGQSFSVVYEECKYNGKFDKDKFYLLIRSYYDFTGATFIARIGNLKNVTG